jgi:uncharacterized protein YlxW (UPF0749 family)
MNSPRARLSIFVVTLVIGLLLVGQLRSQARRAEVSSLPAQELSQLVETLSNRNGELRAELADIREQLRDYRDAGSQGQSALDVTREDLLRVTAFAGLSGVEGEGIRLVISGSLDAIALNDLINELRNAGAEAVAINGVRLTARSVAIQGPRSLVVDGEEVGETFRMTAIGSPDGLLAAMERPGGIIAQLQQFINATISVSQQGSIVMPSTSVPQAPTVAEPVE